MSDEPEDWAKNSPFGGISRWRATFRTGDPATIKLVGLAPYEQSPSAQDQKTASILRRLDLSSEEWVVLFEALRPAQKRRGAKSRAWEIARAELELEERLGRQPTSIEIARHLANPMVLIDSIAKNVRRHRSGHNSRSK